jgi:hypothetical protein
VLAVTKMTRAPAAWQETYALLSYEMNVDTEVGGVVPIVVLGTKRTTTLA